MLPHFTAALLSLIVGAAPVLAASEATIAVEREAFVETTAAGARLSAGSLAGTIMTMATPEGAQFDLRIDSISPAKERPSLSLLSLSVRNPTTGLWSAFCEKDAYGRSAGFPVAGAWDGKGHFLADKNKWFLTCTSGSQGKCILFGYDPWSQGPHGEDLIPYYEACQHMVRADYDGSRWAHTKNGTPIDIWDHIGIQRPDSLADPAFVFEAGWEPEGAACVAKTRWQDLLTRDALAKSSPRFDGPCDEQIAAAKGAILFNRSRR
jgi:hypothetical protein